MNTSTIEDDGVNILKGYTFRMYPNEKQKELIQLHLNIYKKILLPLVFTNDFMIQSK